MGKRKASEQPVQSKPPITVVDNDDVATLMQTGQFRLDAYWRTRDELMKRQLSDTENLDRALITLASAALALSVTFLNAHQDSGSVGVGFLYWSWAAFGMCICSVVLSYHASQRSVDFQTDAFEKYYLREDQKSIEATNKWRVCNDCLMVTATVAFIAGIALMLFYFGNNHFAISKGNGNAGQATGIHQGAGRSQTTQASDHQATGISQGPNSPVNAQQPTERKVDGTPTEASTTTAPSPNPRDLPRK